MIHIALLFSTLPYYVVGLSPSLIPETGSPPPVRDIPGFTYYSTGNKLYIYGGLSDIQLSDMWEFDLTTYKWREIHTISVSNPGPRSRSFMTTLEDKKKLVLFGGNTYNGPSSDLWEYDIVNQTWRLIEEKGAPPPNGYYRTLCSFNHQGIPYLAVYGGIGQGFPIRDLLDLTNYEWIKKENIGFAPITQASGMNYYEGSLYIWGGRDEKRSIMRNLFRYEIDTGVWTTLQISNQDITPAISCGFCLYKDTLYAVDGYVPTSFQPAGYIHKIHLKNGEYSVEEVYNNQGEDGAGGFGFYCKENLMYIFGGHTMTSIRNSLVAVDLDTADLKRTVISEEVRIPNSRSGHAMEVYDDKLYIYGGMKNDGTHFIDMWTFDLNKSIWEPLRTSTSVMPAGRSDFAHTRIDETLVMFGGIGDYGLFNEMYRFNLRLKEWSLIEISSALKPDPRKGSCMAAIEGIIFIYGGISESGYTDELWKFDLATNSYELLSSHVSSLSKLAYSSCRATYDDNNEIIFEVYTGETSGQNPTSSIFTFHYSNKKWEFLREQMYDPISRSKAAVYRFDDNLLLIGGAKSNHVALNDITLFNLSTKTPQLLGTLPNYMYSASSIYYKKKIYIYGGGYSFNTLLLEKMTINNLVVIDLDATITSSCSKGSYSRDGECDTCPEGSYSDSIGASYCKPCPAGYYSDILGADSYLFCKPCPNQTFNDQEGQSRCYFCSESEECSMNQIYDGILAHNEVDYLSIQPELLDEPDSLVKLDIIYFEVPVSILFAILILVMIRFDRTRDILKNLDMYSMEHNYGEDVVVYIRKTIIGGIFTIIFYGAAIIILFRATISYSIDNIVETKALVPLIALEQQYGNIGASQANFEFKFINYVGLCVSDQNTCTNELTITLEDLEGDVQDIECQRLERDCVITFSVSDFDLGSFGSVNVELSEDNSLCSEISIKVEAPSSIPNEVSSITTRVKSESGKYFRGFTPSVISMLLTPSLFLTDTNKWENKLKGFHISESEEPIEGSQIDFSDISTIKNLIVSVELDQSEAVLLTQRLQKQTIFAFFSNLSGSVLGIIGTIGFFMGFIEEKYVAFIEKRSNRLSIQQVYDNRTAIMYKNFCEESSSNTNMNPKLNMSGCTIADIDMTTPKEKDSGLIFTWNSMTRNEDFIFTKVNKVTPQETIF